MKNGFWSMLHEVASRDLVFFIQYANSILMVALFESKFDYQCKFLLLNACWYDSEPFASDVGAFEK